MHQHLARVEEDVKRAILATTLGIELKPAQVGLKVQGRELKLAWAQLLATLRRGGMASADKRHLPTTFRNWVYVWKGGVGPSSRFKIYRGKRT